MTICIAAICEESFEPRIVMCADTRLDAAFAGSSEGNLKIGKISHGCACLLAGDWIGAKEVHQRIRSEFISNGAPADKATLYGMLERSANAYMKEPFYSVAQIDIIVCGFINRIPVIAHLSVWDSPTPFVGFFVGYKAVGSGSNIAEMFLNIRDSTARDSLTRTLYTVYEAKKYSENNVGVGPETKLLVLFPPSPEAGVNQDAAVSVSVEGMKKLESLYARYGLQKLVNFPDAPKGSLFT